ncbi:MAG: sorbosone dehydrogenase family protein, partial [Acidimicrobiia bacterium]
MNPEATVSRAITVSRIEIVVSAVVVVDDICGSVEVTGVCPSDLVVVGAAVEGGVVGVASGLQAAAINAAATTRPPIRRIRGSVGRSGLYRRRPFAEPWPERPASVGSLPGTASSQSPIYDKCPSSVRVMRLAAILVGAVLVAAACSASPSDLGQAGPGTTAPIEAEVPTATVPTQVPHLRLERITDALEEPVALAIRPGDDRVYVAERLGRIVLIDGDAIVPFLDLRDIVFSTISEQGLLGFTFDTEGDRMFVLYTDESFDVQVAAYALDGDEVIIDSATPILTVEQPHIYHQGGGMAFGPDGYLWISLGDGGG